MVYSNLYGNLQWIEQKREGKERARKIIKIEIRKKMRIHWMYEYLCLYIVYNRQFLLWMQGRFVDTTLNYTSICIANARTWKGNVSIYEWYYDHIMITNTDSKISNDDLIIICINNNMYMFFDRLSFANCALWKSRLRMASNFHLLLLYNNYLWIMIISYSNANYIFIRV